MGVERQAGYKYRGWKLGEEVRCKSDGKTYKIVGFDDVAIIEDFIAINRDYWRKNIDKSKKVMSYIKCDSKCFDWVSEDEIEKIEADTESKNKEVMKKIEQYEIERIRQVAEEINKEMDKKNKYIKPNYYKINVAGTECEVKDVIKATVKDYESVLVANIIKYVMRYRGKNGLEDLKKARTYLDELIADMEDRQ